MKRSLSVSAAASACFLVLSLTGSAQQEYGNKDLRQVAAFHGISVSGGIDLYLTEGDATVAIDARSAEAIKHIVTEVENGILKIHPEPNWRPYGNPHIKALVSTRELDKLSGSGGSDIYFETEMHCPSLKVNLSGGSDLKGGLTADDMELNQSGGSDAHLFGKIGKLHVDASGGSDLDGYDLVTDEASINSSGGSDAELTVQKALTVNASGGSDVRYKGTPSVSSVHSSGSSSVTRKR